MKKKDLLEKIGKELGRSQREVVLIIDKALELIEEELASHREVHLVGFGTFVVRDRKKRVGRNPKTGEALVIEASKTPAFIPGKPLLDRVKGR